MDDKIRIDRLEHESLGCGDLAKPREIRPIQHPEVRMGQQPALEGPLAHPNDVGREVRVAVGLQARGHLTVDLGLLARKHQQLLDVVPRDRSIEDLEHLIRRIQVRLVRRERAVLAIAAARPR